jgi:hypothetical protein
MYFEAAHCDFSIARPSVMVDTVPERSFQCVSLSVSQRQTSASVRTIEDISASVRVLQSIHTLPDSYIVYFHCFSPL